MVPHHAIRYVFDLELFCSIVSAVSSGVVAIFTGKVWHVYRKQLATMGTALAETRASNEIAARALELGRRAWLIATNVEAIYPMGHLGHTIGITIENQGGGSPATDIRIQTAAEFFSATGVPEDVTWNWREKVSGAVVGNGDAIAVTAHLRPLNREEIDGAVRGTALIVVRCKIDYRDTFERQRSTSACWWSNVDSRGLVIKSQNVT